MDKESQFINKLTKETLRERIEWEDFKPKGIVLPHDERITSKIYKARVNDRNIRIYEFQYKHYVDEDEWLWNVRVRLEIVDDENETLYEFAYDYALKDLFNAVTKMNSGVDDFIDGFLK